MNRNQLKVFIYQYDKLVAARWRKLLKHRCNGMRRLNEIFHQDKKEHPGSTPDLTDKIVIEMMSREQRLKKHGRGYEEEGDRDVNIIFQRIARQLVKETRLNPKEPGYQAQCRLLYLSLTKQIKNSQFLNGDEALNVPSDQVFITEDGYILHLASEIFPQLQEANKLKNPRTGEEFSAADEGFIQVHYAISQSQQRDPVDRETGSQGPGEQRQRQEEKPQEKPPKKQLTHYEELHRALKYRREWVEELIAQDQQGRLQPWFK